MTGGRFELLQGARSKYDGQRSLLERKINPPFEAEYTQAQTQHSTHVQSTFKRKEITFLNSTFKKRKYLFALGFSAIISLHRGRRFNESGLSQLRFS
jgi:hypothetical protein